MKSLIEIFEVPVDSSLSTISSDVWNSNCMGKRAWELYIGFLYGHPIWRRSHTHSVEEDFEHLSLIWDQCRTDDIDWNAANVAIDAIRDLVINYSDALSRPFNILDTWDMMEEHDSPRILLLDFMVYGKSRTALGRWYHAFDDHDDTRLDASLAAKFSEKVDAKSRGHDHPDITERCRYHLHKGTRFRFHEC